MQTMRDHIVARTECIGEGEAFSAHDSLSMLLNGTSVPKQENPDINISDPLFQRDRGPCQQLFWFMLNHRLKYALLESTSRWCNRESSAQMSG